jgi:hypothetical protein
MPRIPDEFSQVSRLQTSDFCPASLRALCSYHSTLSKVTEVPECPSWILHGGRLRHSKADYFSIGLFRTKSGESLFLMEQTETALVVLLSTTIRGRTYVLLSLRTEPGLIGLTNLSTTIQSTPSNYLRRHGGKKTPFIEIASEPSRHGKVLYDGKHHDWGNYYLNKTKRFLVIHVENPPDAPSGFCWVELEVARSLLAEDNLITNDLRVCLPLVLNHQTAVPGRLFENAPTNDVTHLGESDFLPNAVDSRGTKVSFYRTETQTREVASWIQPLLVPREAMKLELSFCEENGSRLFAIKRGTRPGLLGCHLWFPAEVKGGHVAQRVLTSAEGGRFWKFQIQITLRHVESRSAAIPSQESLTWVTEVELAALVAQPLQTSLELRMAWSLVISRLTGLKPNA